MKPKSIFPMFQYFGKCYFINCQTEMSESLMFVSNVKVTNVFYTEFICTGAEPSPALLVASTKRRGRKCSKDVPDGKETPPKNTEESAPKSRGRGRKPKPKPGNFHFF